MPMAVFSNRSSSLARHAGRGSGSRSVRCEVSVSALPAYGNTKNSKWSLPSTSASSRSSTSGKGRGSSRRWIVKRGTQRIVSSEITPSAPSETRPASRSSPSRSTASPSAVTNRMASTCADRLRKRAPVPWVAVAMAPASACLSMSPWFSSARPRSASSRAQSAILMPAWTLTRPVPVSASRTRFIRDRSTITPSVQAMSVNECPVPTPFTRWALATRSASSSSLPGRSIRSGAHRCSPAQLTQISGICGLYPALDGPAPSDLPPILRTCVRKTGGPG